MTSEIQKISPSDIVPIDIFAKSEPIKIDLVYADAQHPENIFKSALYHSKARLSLHRDLARIIISAARHLYKTNHWILVLKDGLRTIEAQELMMKTAIVKANPQWLIEPRMLSSPGQGGHPRGMAVDVSAIDGDGAPIDMGTVFDCMTQQSSRTYDGFKDKILNNRKILEHSMVGAANLLSLPLLPLPSEWWDFRFPANYSQNFAPIADDDLPQHLQMTKISGNVAMIDEQALAKSILESL